MTTKRTTPAKKEYRVFANATQLVFQTVLARTPAEAHRLADDDAWEYGDFDDSDYVQHDDVEDVATGEMILVGKTTHCKTCGSEIAATMNGGGAFRDGECTSCEYERYKTQPALLDAARKAYSVLCELSYYPFWKSCSYAEKEGNGAIKALADAINNAHGNA